MKLPSVVFFGLLLVFNLKAEDSAVPTDVGQPAVIGTDNSSATPNPDYKVIESHTERVLREEPAPLQGMTPVRKVVDVTVQRVADPHLVAPKPSSQVLDEAELPEPINPEATEGEQGESQLIFVSAMVYDHKRTLLTWSTSGEPNDEMVAWSNIDFNQFVGIGSVTFKGRSFGLMLSVGNGTATGGTSGTEDDLPPVPALPADVPAFVLTGGAPNDADSITAITGLHELYRRDAARLEAAYKARLEREAFLRMHPPEPKDIQIRVWKNDQPTATKNTKP